jgi:ASC-1-like (ASCH) protein
MTEEISVSEPWFSHIKHKKKKIEGRLNKGKFAELKKDQIIKIKNSDSSDSFSVKIRKIRLYKTFEEYLSQEGLKRTLPGIKSIEEGIGVYRKFYSKENEESYGIVAISVKYI